MLFVKLYPLEAKGFGEEDAKQEDLEVAISSISKAFWNSNITNPNFILNQSVVESIITSELTQCYEIRKVKSFLIHITLQFDFHFGVCLSRMRSSYANIKIK